MNNKKLILPVAILVALIILVFVLVFYPAPAQGLAGLPEEGSLLVWTLVTAAVTWALVQIGAALNINLGGYVQPIAAILAPILITLIEKYLALIPSTFDSIALTIIHLIVLAIGSVGTLIILKKVKAKETPTLLA
jgi:hypothetical protein